LWQRWKNLFTIASGRNLEQWVKKVFFPLDYDWSDQSRNSPSSNVEVYGWSGTQTNRLRQGIHWLLLIRYFCHCNSTVLFFVLLTEPLDIIVKVKPT
jgi:hypothetical protein